MISEMSLVNLAKTTPYSLEDIRKIAAQVDNIGDLFDILSHAKATNSNPFEVLREFEKHGGIFYDGKNYHDEEDMKEEEKQELDPEAIQAAARAITDIFLPTMQQAADTLAKITQSPGFQALLAALPEPEPEEEYHPTPGFLEKGGEEIFLNLEDLQMLQETTLEDNPVHGIRWLLSAYRSGVRAEPGELGQNDQLSICPDLLEKATEFLFPATTFTIPATGESIRRPLYIKKRYHKNKEGWAIFFAGDVWSREAHDFVWEPQPSSRTDEFLADTRFSLADALRIVEDLKK